jgi:dTDP-4-amino-4,6-dideoxygalactose transaminase
VTESIPFALPDVGEAEIAAVAAAIRSGWVSSGPKVKEFESAFSRELSDEGELEAVAVNSATAGLHLALEAIGIGPGDEVLVPTWTFTATAEVVRYMGAEPILVDVEENTLNIDLEAAAALITGRTRALIPVHFAGMAVDSAALRTFSLKHDLEVVEDAAHAFPAATGGRRVGANRSAATVFSFYATKTMTTGEGGMLVTPRPDLAARARVMRLHGISRDAFDRYRSATPSWRYEVVAPGFKYNMTDIAAAMGLIQLARANEMRSRRAGIATRYRTAFQDLPLDLPMEPSGEDMHAWHLFVVRVKESDQRDNLIEHLACQGVGTSVHFIPLHEHPFWRDYTMRKSSDFPVASSVYPRVVSLPIYSSMSDADVAHVISAVSEFFGS